MLAYPTLGRNPTVAAAAPSTPRQARVLIVAALAIAALLVPTGRMAINMVRPAGGVSTQSDTSTTTPVSTPATVAAAPATAAPATNEAEDKDAGSKNSVKNTNVT